MRTYTQEDLNIAWAAGLFEGEGCIYVRQSASTCTLSLNMTDEDSVRRFHQIVGCGTIRIVKGKGTYKDQFNWSVGARDKCQKILEKFSPFLSARRLGKMEEVFALPPPKGKGWANSSKIQCNYGHEFTEDNTYTWKGIRQCKICRSRRERERAARRAYETV